MPPTPQKPTATLTLLTALTLLTHQAIAAPAPTPCPAPGQTTAYCPLTAYPLAKCNDNTPATYHIRLSPTASPLWLFYLEGGAECNDEPSCKARRQKSKTLTTATNWQANAGGILSPNPTTNPDFANANTIQVHYCSSDFWSGNKQRTTSFLSGNATTGWNFQGRAIATAALANVIATAPNFANAKHILFAGSSAGGIGIALTFNDLAPMLPAKLRKSLAIDAGYTLQIKGFSAEAPPRYALAYSPGVDLLKAGHTLWQGHGDTACVAQQGNVLACYLSGALVNAGAYGNTPVFVAEAEADTAQLFDSGWKYSSPLSTPEQTYLHEFAAAMAAELQQSPTQTAIYAPSLLTHEFFTSDTLFNTGQAFPAPANQTTPRQALHAWFRTEAPPPRLFGTAPLP